MTYRSAFALITLTASLTSVAQNAGTDSVGKPELLDEVVVTSGTTVRKLTGATNTTLITEGELRRAACCNLGESFTTNPSVDVNYSDAATGARQIRLLGLSGAYVQMMTENIPSMRGAAAPFGLSYTPGPWMQSIQVSKGASSVKNGFESITGQINVKLKKTQADPSLSVNMYYDSMNKLELNLDGNLRLGRHWSGGVLVHAENAFTAHDGNDDGFADIPRTRQISFMNRWARMGVNHVFQGAFKLLGEWRRGGQTTHHGSHAPARPYLIDIDTRRAEFFTKNAYIFNHKNDINVAVIISGSYHDQDATYGLRRCDIAHGEGYVSAMFERKWRRGHALSVGASFTIDDFVYNTALNPSEMDFQSRTTSVETATGAYAQYTYSLGDRLTAMAGLRYDRHHPYGNLITPRMHVRWNITDACSVHASAGRGHRAPHPLAEYGYLLASSRRLVIETGMRMESAWNTGFGTSFTFRPLGRPLTLSAEYYYTDFSRQLMADLDSDPHAAFIFTSDKRSFSHTLQVEATLAPRGDLNISAAWRLTDVKADYGNGLVQKPLTSKHKALLTIGYTPMMGLWQADVTFAVNGGGRFPTPATGTDGRALWPSRYKAFTQLSAQVTRNFRHWAVYIGGENLTGFRQKHPIIGASDPWGPDFDATMVYGPLHGAMVYVGFRFNVTKYI